MLNIEHYGMDMLYRSLFDAVMRHGYSYGPRGKSCIEVRPATIVINSPELALYSGKSRRLNYRFWAIETLCYLAGWSGPKQAELILASNKNMSFAMNKETRSFDGAYGASTKIGLPRVYTELLKDPDSRRAMLSMWQYEQDMTSKDIPCTAMMHFFRDTDGLKVSQLSCAVYMRSNDLNWGTPYDIAAFCAIQIAMARALGMNIGRYYHHVGSLHYYTEGNSQGEKPPVIAALDVEEWLSEDMDSNIFIPTPNVTVPFSEIATECDYMLSDMLTYLHDGGKLSDYHYVCENMLDTYMLWWVQFINWTWSNK